MQHATIAIPWVLLLMAVGGAVACDGASSRAEKTTAASGSAASSSTASTRAASSGAPDPGDDAALERTRKALVDHPPLDVPYAWEKRLRAHLRGESDGDACPTAAPSPKNDKMLGHKNYRTTERYAHIADDSLRNAVNRRSQTIIRAGRIGSKAKRGPRATTRPRRPR